MQLDLVSLLTPCYNTAAYIHRLLDSVLIQTYPAIEMVCIDDGSSDNVAEIVESYIPKFEARGYSLRLIKQANQGQSAAINNGLKFLNGKYFAWPDSDDFYSTPEAIAKMVGVLKAAPKGFAMARAVEDIVEDGTFKVMGVNGLNRPYYEDAKLFVECLFQTNGYYFCPGAYMVDFEVLKEETDLEIYASHDAGQNWQLMLPVLYRHRCITIPEHLYNVVNRAMSHSRGQYAGFTKTIQKYRSYERTIIATLVRIKGMSKAELRRYRTLIMFKYAWVRLRAGLSIIKHFVLLSGDRHA